MYKKYFHFIVIHISNSFLSIKKEVNCPSFDIEKNVLEEDKKIKIQYSYFKRWKEN